MDLNVIQIRVNRDSISHAVLRNAKYQIFTIIFNSNQDLKKITGPRSHKQICRDDKLIAETSTKAVLFVYRENLQLTLSNNALWNIPK